MKALVLEATEKPPIAREAPRPEPADGEALVRLHAAALNHRDVWIMQGQYPGIRIPIILGSDGAGIVEAVQGGDESWVGREVLLNPSLNWGPNPDVQADGYAILGLPRDGTFAEYIAIPLTNLEAKPQHLTFQQAAALPLAGLTAYRALMTRAKLKASERVLISGVGGGVALFAMQFAVAAGAEVFVTSGSDQKIERAIEMGAKGGVNYTEDGWRHKAAGLAPAGFDVVIDSAGGEGFGELLRVLGPAGRIVFYGGTRGKWPQILPQHLFFKQISILATTMGSPEDFQSMLSFVDTHQIVPTVDRVFPLGQGGEAFTYLEAGNQLGKVVLSID